VSLAWRILLVVLVLNLLTVGSVQLAASITQRDWFRRQANTLIDATLVSFLQRVYSVERLATAEAQDSGTRPRELLLNPAIRELFDDVVVTSGLPPYSTVYLNPRGAVRRDPELFPRAAILASMNDAAAADGVVPAAGGYCLAIRRGDEIGGYLWFRPRGAFVAMNELPVWFTLVAVLAGTLLFGAVVFWTVRRTVGRPLDAVGAAAARVGAGNYGVRLPALLGLRELDDLVTSFNAMAGKVQGHTSELEQAVRAAVEETKRTERALVVSSRLAAVGTLAAGIAHEINNPIGGMLNAVNRLLAAPDLADKQRTYLQLVHDGLQRVANTARKVLDFSPRQVQAQPFALARAVDGARALVEHRLQQMRVQLRVDLPADLPQVFGDSNEIQQVVLNLVLNSLDALGSRGGGGVIAVRGHAGDGRVHLHIDDDGPGMEPKDLGRVFEPFFSQKDRPDASGLGMFISYSIVRNHGGDIELDSAPGAGFRVHITLPAAAPAPGTPGRGG
jgi:signal transduction histidine kinase